MESEDTHLIRHVKLARPVEVENRVEGPRMTIKEVFVVEDGVVRTEIENVVIGVGPAELAEPGVWDLLQHPPHHLVPHSAHVELHSPVEQPRLLDLVRGRRSRPLLSGDERPGEAWEYTLTF